MGMSCMRNTYFYFLKLIYVYLLNVYSCKVGKTAAATSEQSLEWVTRILSC